MARIRTIKPEFWSHPIMARSPDEVRVGAIGLLNYADDEGYFLAEPAAVRSFVWPFDDDSSKARRVLANLSRIGYVELVEHPDHGAVGRVLNFSKHQRVDRPNQSKLKAYFHSPNVRRSIDDQSLLEQGTGNREQGCKPAAAAAAGSAAIPTTPPPQDPVKVEIWRSGRSLMESEGMTGERAGSFIGKLVKDWGQQLVIESIRDAVKVSPAKPSEWLVARCQERRANSGRQARLEAHNDDEARAFVSGGRA